MLHKNEYTQMITALECAAQPSKEKTPRGKKPEMLLSLEVVQKIVDTFTMKVTVFDCDNIANDDQLDQPKSDDLSQEELDNNL